METFGLDILAVFGTLVGFCIGILMILLFFEIVRARKQKTFSDNISKDDFFTNIENISSDVGYFSQGLFTKNFRLEFRKVGLDDKTLLAFASGEIENFTKLGRRIHIRDAEAVIFAKLAGNAGSIMARLSKGGMTVKFAGIEIGKIDFSNHSFLDPAGKKIGSFDRSGMRVSGADILRLPFFSKKENFSVSQKVYMGGRAACTINFRKWPDRTEPLFQNLERKLGSDENILIFLLAAVEWTFSINIRE